MTKLEAMRAIVSKPREVGMDRIGRRVLYATSDGREKTRKRINSIADWLRTYRQEKAS